MRFVADTNRYSDAAAGEANAAQMFRQAERIYLPFIVIAELRMGFVLGRLRMENEQKLTGFLNSGRVEAIYPDEQTTIHYAVLAAHVRRQETPLPTNDLWIAAICVQRGVALYTRDAHFDCLAQLMRV